jgi:AhpD family alkylhydroperoxidase
MTKGRLDRKTKEFICLAVSAVNSCSYCVNAHTAMLKQLGATDEEIIEAVAVADLFNGFRATDRIRP